MIGEKRSFSFISPIVKLIICRVHDQYVEKKIVWFQKFSIPPPLPQNKLNFWAFENPPPTPPPTCSGISNPFCGGSMDIFWSHTLNNY